MDKPRQYERAVLEAHPASDIAPLAPELQAKLDAADWPPGLIERILAVRPDRGAIEEWLDSGFPGPERLAWWVEKEAALQASSLVARQATWEDHDMLTDLCANAAEKVGDWNVTVERGPYAYAQMRLQEHQSVIVMEDDRVGLAMASHSTRNTLIQGEKTSVHFMSGWRVRDGFRGLGLSHHLQMAPGPGASWFGLITYYFVRSGNSASSWIDKVEGDMAERDGGFGPDADRLTASVSCLDVTAHPGSNSRRARPATEADLEQCVALINQTHAGLDLFRPYTLDYLEQRLNDPSWGPKPSFRPEVYGWDEFRVIEADGDIVACGGLWDRGRDLREVWEHRETNERFVVDPTAVMDFGFAEGQEVAMAELIDHFCAQSATLGRSGMLISLEMLDGLRAELSGIARNVETRELHVLPFSSPEITLDLTISRPYIDLAYW